MKRWQTNKTIKILPALALTFGVLAPLPATASIVEECFGDQCTITFGYTGQIEPLTFPANATNVRFEALGAQGGKSGGGGGRVTGNFNEVPSILYITVGGAGGSNAFAEGGFNGGGTAGGSAGVEGSGGGASDIRIGFSLSSRIVVAGGGGGRGSGLGSGGGAGGGLVGGTGKTGQGTGGTGGSQDAGGAGGLPYGEGSPGTAGDWGVGGSGGSGPLHGGGGGGGGYYGGGGGGPDEDWCCTDAGGGGGGSSYTDSALISNVVHTQGVRPGAGQITISYQLVLPPEPTPPSEDPVGPPTEESVTPPAESTAPPAEEPTAPPIESNNPTEDPVAPPSNEDSSTSGSTDPNPSDPEPVVPPVAPDAGAPDPGPIANPEPEQTQAPFQEVQVPSPTQGITEVVLPEVVSIESNPVGPRQIISSPKDPIVASEIEAVDEILQQPSDLRQAAQSVVVPVQNKQQPFSSNTLFAGVIGLGIFALIAGIVVARRGVPGAIAS